MSEKFPSRAINPNQPTPEQSDFIESVLGDTDFRIQKENPDDFVDTEPDKFAWKDPVSSIMDYQVGAAEKILEGAPATPVTPGKTDKFELPKISVATDKKPELARPSQINTTTPEVRLDQKFSPIEVEKRRMREREAKKNKKGFFARLFGGQ